MLEKKESLSKKSYKFSRTAMAKKIFKEKSDMKISSV